MNSNLPISRKPLSSRKKLLFTLVISLVLVLFIGGIGEVVICRVDPVQEKPPIPPPYNTAQKDERLGWCMTPNYTFDGKMRDSEGKEYPISIRYDANGFKVFGDTTTTKPKVLFLGDSFTASVEVSNEKSFFSLLKDSLDVEVFAYGHAGFGTLQEYMVLEQWVDQIKPDIVVWEVCSNDFIDNYTDLEISCSYKVGERRPYLQPDGSITYQLPISFFQKMQAKSLFLKWLVKRLEILYYKATSKERRVGEFYIAVDKRNYRPFDDAVMTTEQIVGLIKKRMGPGMQVLAFSADIFQPQMDEFRRIFETNGFVFTEAPARVVEKAAVEQKLIVKSIDGCHWNEKGHELVAQSLMEDIKRMSRE